MNCWKPKLICYSVCTDHTDMANINYDFGGNAPSVSINTEEKQQLKEALTKHGATKVAKDLGIGRTYVYRLLDFHSIELLRFSSLCKRLEVKILTDNQIDNFLNSLKERIY